MRMVETIRSRFQREPLRQWTADETLRNLELLQGQVVDIMPVLERKNKPDHVHSFPDLNKEPEPLRSTVMLALSQKSIPVDPWVVQYFNVIDSAYREHYKRHGVEGPVHAAISSPSEQRPSGIGILMIPKIHKMWPPKATTSFFQWIDFQCTWRSRNFAAYFSINTTKEEGSFYRIDIPHSYSYNRLSSSDTFVMENKDQRLISDLLTARV